MLSVSSRASARNYFSLQSAMEAQSQPAAGHWQLVRYGPDGKVEDLNEFLIAKCLLAGEIEVLSQQDRSRHTKARQF